MARVFTCCALLAALMLVASQSAIAQVEANINWRVENPFRLFTDPADTRRHRATFDALTEQEKENPVLAVERRLARQHPDGWAAELSGELCWNEQTYEYRCKRKQDKYIHPSAHRVEAWLDFEQDLASEKCTQNALRQPE